MTSRDQRKEGHNDSFFIALIRSSLILSALDRFTAYLYALLQKGFFGYIFTGYQHSFRSWFADRLKTSKLSVHFAEFRYGICRRIETSVIIYFCSTSVKYLLGCKLRVYGVFTASFGAYTAVISIISFVLRNQISEILNDMNMLIALVLIFASLPLLLSRKTLSAALISSVVGKIILHITGYSAAEISTETDSGGHSNKAFLIGILLGALTYFIQPIYILGGIAALIWAYLVLVRPEIGVLTLFFMMPLFPTMLLAAVVVYTTLCWGIKLFRGKRIFRAEPVDIMALAFLVLTFFGGTVSLSSSSLKPALLLVCFGCAYFLTVQLLSEREWIIRCSSAAVLSASIVSVYGIVLYYLGAGYSSAAWIDSDMFEAISGRAVATLENPNMLGEYLILIIPIAVSMLIGRGEGLQRFSAAVCIAVMGACLILTWSRGAWLGLVFSALVFLFMWHRRAIWVIFAGIAMVPVLPSVLPESIVHRFLSIGNLADSSTSYRIYIWQATLDMIRDHVLTGIGIGEGAWDRLYPIYAYQGVESAPHAHNLFLQIWLELGLAGILAFVIFLFLLYQSGFSLFARLSNHSELKNNLFSENMMMRTYRSSDKTDAVTERKQAKFQLRISAAGPLCAIFGVLVQGMTDYAWYNYRLYLMFWLMCGLACAYIRSGHHMIADGTEYADEDACKSSALIYLETTEKKQTQVSDSR